MKTLELYRRLAASPAFSHRFATCYGGVVVRFFRVMTRKGLAS